MTDTNTHRINQPGAAAKSYGLPAAEKSGQDAHRLKGASPEPSRIAERAYELYVERDRQDGGAVGDWLKAEQQLLATVSHA